MQTKKEREGHDNTEERGLDRYRYLSLEYLLIHLQFKLQAPPALLLLLLKKSAVSSSILFDALKSGNMASIQNILTVLRRPLPTAEYFDQIIDLVSKEKDISQATHLLRYLLFFPMEPGCEAALPLFIQNYRGADPFIKREMVNSCCWAATVIPVTEVSQ
jgi:hypothetical protein